LTQPDIWFKMNKNPKGDLFGEINNAAVSIT
jgi:hypothetical protein